MPGVVRAIASYSVLLENVTSKKLDTMNGIEPSRCSLGMIARFILCAAFMDFYFFHATAMIGSTINGQILTFGLASLSSNLDLERNSSTDAAIQEVLPSQSTSIKSHRYLLYITTIFSSGHQNIFKHCWPELMNKSKLLRDAHVLIFSNNRTEVKNTTLSRVRDLFSRNPSFRFEFAPDSFQQDLQNLTRRTPWMKNTDGNRVQFGANEAVRLGFANQWFSDYAWVIRINPDVFIRNSSWILQAMSNPSIDGIFVECNPSPKLSHTDFFAVRPSACAPDAFDQMVEGEDGRANHEMTAAKEFDLIVRSNRHVWLPDNAPSGGMCRVRGSMSSVLHTHNAVRQKGRTGQMFCIHNSNWNIT